MDTRFKKGHTPWTKGVGHSEATKLKISQNNYWKGKVGEKSSQWKGGKPNCIECGKKLAAYSAKFCKSCKQKGNRNQSWKGGVAKYRDLIRRTDQYKLWRDSVFQRDQYLCQMPNCDKIERYLQVHHIKTFAKFPELRFEVSNGITLCKKCHRSINRKEQLYEQMFMEILKVKNL